MIKNVHFNVDIYKHELVNDLDIHNRRILLMNVIITLIISILFIIGIILLIMGLIKLIKK